MESILCAHPNIIWNPNVRKWANESINVYHDTDMSRCFRLLLTLDGSLQLARPDNITSVDACHYYMIYRGQRVYPFLVVPCGKCHLCVSRKKQDLAFRFEAETSAYPFVRPLFVTLTFDEDHVPVNYPDYYGNNIVYGNCLPDPEEDIDLFLSVTRARSLTLDNRSVQLFFKRLRINLKRHYGIVPDLRYYCVGEYGKNTCRPHYHMIIWNFPSASDFKLTHADDAVYLTFCEDVIRNAWKNASGVKGVQVEFCGQARSHKSDRPSTAGVAKYVAKYVFKGSKSKPQFGIPNHSLQSVATGGIGKRYIKDKADYYYTMFKDYRIQVTNPFDYSTTSAVLPQTYRRFLFPSFSQFLGRRMYSLIKQLSVIDNAIRSSGETTAYVLDDIRELLDDVYDRSSLVPESVAPVVLSHYYHFGENPQCAIDALACIARRIYNEVIDEYIAKIEEFDYIQECKERRRKYLDSLPRQYYDVESLEYQQQIHDDRLSMTEAF